MLAQFLFVLIVFLRQTCLSLVRCAALFLLLVLVVTIHCVTAFMR